MRCQGHTRWSASQGRLNEAHLASGFEQRMPQTGCPPRPNRKLRGQSTLKLRGARLKPPKPLLAPRGFNLAEHERAARLLCSSVPRRSRLWHDEDFLIRGGTRVGNMSERRHRRLKDKSAMQVNALQQVPRTSTSVVVQEPDRESPGWINVLHPGFNVSSSSLFVLIKNVRFQAGKQHLRCIFAWSGAGEIAPGRERGAKQGKPWCLVWHSEARTWQACVSSLEKSRVSV
jgi:hypothetical protein